jgi:hypothetical protein
MVVLTPPPPSLLPQSSAELFHRSSPRLLEADVTSACRKENRDRVQRLLRMSVEIIGLNPSWGYQLGRDIDAGDAHFRSHSHFRFPSSL